jgi:hypothetical protein
MTFFTDPSVYAFIAGNWRETLSESYKAMQHPKLLSQETSVAAGGPFVRSYWQAAISIRLKNSISDTAIGRGGDDRSKDERRRREYCRRPSSRSYYAADRAQNVRLKTSSPSDTI